MKRVEPWLCIDNEYICSYESGEVKMSSDAVFVPVKRTYLYYTALCN